MTSRFLPSWVIIPAAGIGSRMQADRPKQYLPLSNKTVIEHTLQGLALVPKLKGIVVAISEQDIWWSDIEKPSTVELITVIGGEERVHSVANALQGIRANAVDDDWVMVHDAARPCIDLQDIESLHSKISAEQADGGILGLPVADTLKRVNHSSLIETTVDRKELWRALTPQMFRYNDLQQAIKRTLDAQECITDDAQAIELMQGKQTVVVDSSPMNIKITHPKDLRLAEIYMQELENAK